MEWEWSCKKCKARKFIAVGQQYVKCDECGEVENIAWYRPVYHGD